MVFAFPCTGQYTSLCLSSVSHAVLPHLKLFRFLLPLLALPLLDDDEPWTMMSPPPCPLLVLPPAPDAAVVGVLLPSVLTVVSVPPLRPDLWLPGEFGCLSFFHPFLKLGTLRTDRDVVDALSLDGVRRWLF